MSLYTKFNLNISVSTFISDVFFSWESLHKSCSHHHHITIPSFGLNYVCRRFRAFTLQLTKGFIIRISNTSVALSFFLSTHICYFVCGSQLPSKVSTVSSIVPIWTQNQITWQRSVSCFSAYEFSVIIKQGNKLYSLYKQLSNLY